MSKLKVIVVGAGWAGNRHLDALRCVSDHMELHAIVGRSANSNLIADQRGVPWYNDISKVEGDFDCAIIASPTEWHIPHIRQVYTMNPEAFIFVEKPLFTSPSEEELLESVDEDKITVGFHRRHHNNIWVLKDMIENKEFGDILQINSFFQVRKPDDYFNNRDIADPLIVSNLVHEVDLIQYLFGDIVMLKGYYDAVDDNRSNLVAVGSITVEGKAPILCTLSATDASMSPFNWETTSNETLQFPDHRSHGFNMIIAGTKKTAVFPKCITYSASNEPSDDWTSYLHSRMASSSVMRESRTFDNQMMAWSQFIKGNVENPCTIAEALSVNKCVSRFLGERFV